MSPSPTRLQLNGLRAGEAWDVPRIFFPFFLNVPFDGMICWDAVNGITNLIMKNIIETKLIYYSLITFRFVYLFFFKNFTEALSL